MTTTLRINDFGYSGPVHKWVRQPMPAGAVGAQEQLHLLKWVKSDELIQVPTGPRYPQFVPVGSGAHPRPSAADEDGGGADREPSSLAAAPGVAGAASAGPSASAPYSVSQQPSQSAPFESVMVTDEQEVEEGEEGEDGEAAGGGGDEGGDGEEDEGEEGDEGEDGEEGEEELGDDGDGGGEGEEDEGEEEEAVPVPAASLEAPSQSQGYDSMDVDGEMY